MRRLQCEITDEAEIIEILAQNNIGRMASNGADGFPYITPVNFVFHNGKVYFHCAHAGEKMDNIKRDDKVCFEVDAPLSYLEVAFNRTNKACHVHQLYKSVIIRGRAAVVPNGDVKADALNALAAKHEGNHDFNTLTPNDPMVKACAVVEITPESMSGKADLLQDKPDEDRRAAAADLSGRGLPGDLEAVKSMGFELEGGPEEGWRLKE